MATLVSNSGHGNLQTGLFWVFSKLRRHVKIVMLVGYQSGQVWRYELRWGVCCANCVVIMGDVYVRGRRVIPFKFRLVWYLRCLGKEGWLVFAVDCAIIYIHEQISVPLY